MAEKINRRFSSTETGYPMPRDYVGGNPDFRVQRMIDSHSSVFNDEVPGHFPMANGGAQSDWNDDFYSATDRSDSVEEAENETGDDGDSSLGRETTIID